MNDCQLSDQEFDDEIASIDSQTNVMDHNASNDIIDSQLNSKDDLTDNNDARFKKRELIISVSSIEKNIIHNSLIITSNYLEVHT